MEKKSSKIKDFFNKPAPLIIVLIIIVFAQTMYIASYNSKNKIYVGKLDEKAVQVANVHYFTNGDMNYFYASPALYIAEDEDIYSYQIGYYVENSDGTLTEFATRSNTFENKSSLKEVVDEMSAWSFAESDKGSYFFTDKVINKMDKLHFVIKASTKKDSDEASINIDYKIDETKITK